MISHLRLIKELLAKKILNKFVVSSHPSLRLFLRVLQFSSFHKKTALSNSNSTRNTQTLLKFLDRELFGAL